MEGSFMVDYWKDRTVVVTGAGQGQGAAEAVALARLGARVIALDVIDADDPRWDALRQECGDAQEKLMIHSLDVSQPTEWEVFVSRLQADGIRVHGLINNAGITLRKTVGQT